MDPGNLPGGEIPRPHNAGIIVAQLSSPSYFFPVRLSQICPWCQPTSASASLLAAALLFAGGCSTYDGKPDALGAAAVDAALAAPSIESVKVAAARLQHPLVAPLTIDGRDGFTPEEVAVMAVVTSPQLRALRAQRGVSRAQVVQAGILPNPQLGYSLDKPVGNDDAGLVNGKSLGLSWEVTSLLGRHDRIASARATADALDLTVAWQEWQTAQNTRLSAYRLLVLQQRLPLLRAIETDLGDTVAAFQVALSHGHATTNELTGASDAWITARSNRLAAEKEDRAERSALNLALGLPADADFKLKPANSISALPADLTPAALLQGLEQRRLDLVALTLGYESNEATLRAAVKAQFPKIGLSFARVNDTSDVRTHTFGITVDIPLFDRGQGAIANGKATRQQLFDEYIARVAEARAQVPLIFADLAATRAQLATSTAALPEWERLVAAYEKAEASGHSDAPAYRDARGALATHRLEQAALQQQVFELEVALEIATGRAPLNPPPST